MALNPSWQHSMLRVKNPLVSLEYYQKMFNMTYIHKKEFKELKATVYFLQSLPTGTEYKSEPGSPEALKFLTSTNAPRLALSHKWGVEDEKDFSYHPGNQKGDGFGHIAFSCENLEAACDKLEKAGVKFKKKPSEGRMRSIAFVYDPDQYWVEIVTRKGKEDTPYFSMAQTMLRVKDPAVSVPFYTKNFGMSLLREMKFDSFSLFFLASLPEGMKAPEDPTKPNEILSEAYANNISVLELTHNHGTEKDDKFKHNTGNEKDKKGFRSLGFLVDNKEATAKFLVDNGYGGENQGFFVDPDGYTLDLVQRSK